MFKATCDQCNTLHMVPLEHSGKRVRCARCGHIFRCPEDLQLWRSELERAMAKFGTKTARAADLTPRPIGSI
jgi:predicted Zn finger-like uncharacterized protein